MIITLLKNLLLEKEFTVNAYVDFQGNLLQSIPHLRMEVRGEVNKGITVKNKKFSECAEQIVNALPMIRGAFCFQLIEKEDESFSVIEINARFGVATHFRTKLVVNAFNGYLRKR